MDYRGLGLVWTSGPTRSDRDQHQTRSRTRHRNLTRLVSYVLLTSLILVGAVLGPTDPDSGNDLARDWSGSAGAPSDPGKNFKRARAAI